MLQKEGTSLKTIGKLQHSPFSSFLNKCTSKPILPIADNIIPRAKSKSISSKPTPEPIISLSSPKSSQITAFSPVANNSSHNTFESPSASKHSIAFRDTKKSSILNSTFQNKELSKVTQSAEPDIEELDRYTFYSSEFSLFDAKTPLARSPTDLVNVQSRLLLPSNCSEAKEASQTDLHVESIDNGKRVLMTSKSCKSQEFASSNKTGYISFKSSKTMKDVPNSQPVHAYKFTDSFSTKIKQRNTSPSSNSPSNVKSQKTLKQMIQPTIYYLLPNKKRQPKDMRILRSISPSDGVIHQKETKPLSYMNKNSSVRMDSPKSVAYKKVSNKMQSRDSCRLASETQKKLGRSCTDDINSKTLRETRFLSSKTGIKKTRSILQNYSSYREVNSLCDNVHNNTAEEASIEKVNKIHNRMKTIDDHDFGWSGSISNANSTISRIQTDAGNTVTCTSVEQEIYKSMKSAKQAVIRKNEAKVKNKVFDDFFSSAMSYMCEVIVSREISSSNFEKRVHEERLNLLLDHIISESMGVKQERQELLDRVKIGKCLMILAEMMLRSVIYLVRRDYPLQLIPAIKDDEISVFKKERKIGQIRFEDVCGLSEKEAACEANEQNVRRNLCYEVEKRREELDLLEEELERGNQIIMLEYVQNIQNKINKILIKENESKN